MWTRRRLLITSTGLAAAAGATGLVVTMPTKYYDGPLTPHWNGTVFSNPGRPRLQGFTDLLRWQFGGGRATWPDAVPVTPATPPARVDGADIRVTMVGHATLLIQTQGVAILTDPVWSDRASPVAFAGPKRVAAPGIAFDDLPRIDAVLVSHNHYDHLDVATLARLWEQHRPRILTPLGNDAIIQAAVPGIAVETLDWHQSAAPLGGVRCHLMPMHHWSARGMFDRNWALWGAFVLETPAGVIYHVGDTGYADGDTFRAVRERFGPPRLAILPIGAYEPRWFMSYSHMNPDEAVRAAMDCAAETVIAHHWGCFQLTNEGIDEPRGALTEAIGRHHFPAERFHAPRPGESVVV